VDVESEFADRLIGGPVMIHQSSEPWAGVAADRGKLQRQCERR
jgi:hypothetical protein